MLVECNSISLEFLITKSQVEIYILLIQSVHIVLGLNDKFLRKRNSFNLLKLIFSEILHRLNEETEILIEVVKASTLDCNYDTFFI